MHNEMLREELLASFQQLQNQFNSSLEEAKALDREFASRYQQFKHNLSGQLAEARAKLPKTSPLSQSLTEFISGLEKQDSAWKAKLESQDKGLSFRKNFEDSLLVYVYGKVKSGKSSLGNYMAWGYTDPTEQQQQQHGQSPLEYKSYENSDAENGDARHEAERREKFRVGATEATSSIQSFRLPGLTWVDSPGLHSVRMQNGALAREHADHADLILYTMKSDAPGRASDLAEIRTLCSKEKNIMLLLTGSDKKEHDWDEENDVFLDRLVMKPASDRQLQCEYVKKELIAAELDADNIEILSVSARYAEHNANDAASIRESGMGQLFSTLYSISQEKGVRMKRAVPIRNFTHFLNSCIKEVEQYRTLTGKFSLLVAEMKTRTDQQMRPAILEAQSTMRRNIEAQFNALTAHRDSKDRINNALTAAKHTWDDEAETLITQALDRILSDVMTNFKSKVVATWTASELKLPEFSVQTITENIPDGYIKSTRGRRSGIGAALGGIAGSFLGPLGTVAGASLGGALGAAAGSSARVSTRSIEIAIGDNLNALHVQVQSLYNDVVGKEIEHRVNTLLSTLLIDMSDACTEINNEISNFKAALVKLQATAKDKLISEEG